MLIPRKALFTVLGLTISSVAWADYQPGELIVKYRQGVTRSRSDMNVFYNTAGVKHIRRYSGIMKGLEHLILEKDAKLEEVIAELSKNPAVEYIQPNYKLYALPIVTTMEVSRNEGARGIPCIFPGIPFPPGCDDSEDPGTPPTNPPNPADPAAGSRPPLKEAPAEVNGAKDPDLSKAYGLAKIHAVDAWAIHRGDKKFVVADIDTGIDYNHQDLSFNIWRNPEPSDKNDVAGFDFVHNDGLPYDDHGHGTHTAGTIGAVGDNGIGISGVAQRVSIMSLKFLQKDGSGTSADAIRAIDYAVSHGAKVLSNSWGGKADPDNQALKDAIERAKNKDVLFVAAAGNEGTDNDGSDPDFPAAFDNDNIVAVAATDNNDSMAYFSNYGKKTTHVAAPGVDVYSTIPGNKYKTMNGTSMACPHVAGAAALVWSKHPEWTYKKVKEVLMNTVDRLPSLEGKTVSGGRINVLSALNSKE